MKEKKVLYIAGRVSKSVGAYHSLLTNINELKSMGVKPLVVISKHNDLVESDFKKYNIEYKIVYFTSCTVPYDNPSKIKGFIKSIINFFGDLKIKKIIKKEKIDLVHINVSTICVGAIPALKLNIPLVWHLREFLEEDVNMTYINKKKMTKLLSLANQTIAISNAILEHFKKEYKIFNTITIYNGINFEGMKKRKLFNKNEICFTLIGRIVPQKGAMEAIKAFEMLLKENKNIHLLIVGNIGNMGYYNKIIEYIKYRKLEKNITVLEHQNNLNEIWDKTDIALVCSKKEGFGRVTAEFMLNGIPVIASNTGGSVELLQNERGILYNYEDLNDLYNKMKFSINNKKIIQEYANNALKYAEKTFYSKKIAKSIKEIYDKII